MRFQIPSRHPILPPPTRLRIHEWKMPILNPPGVFPGDAWYRKTFELFSLGFFHPYLHNKHLQYSARSI